MHQAACGTQIGLDCGTQKFRTPTKMTCIVACLCVAFDTNSSNALPDVERLQQNLSKLNLLILDLKQALLSRGSELLRRIEELLHPEVLVWQLQFSICKFQL